jgi:hypothetical protein
MKQLKKHPNRRLIKMGRGVSEEFLNEQFVKARTFSNISLPKENQLILFEERYRLRGKVGKKVKQCIVVKEYTNFFLIKYANDRTDTLHKADFLTGDIKYKPIQFFI